MQGCLFSVALSLELLRPGVTRRRIFIESGLSSLARGDPAIRAFALGPLRGWVNLAEARL